MKKYFSGLVFLLISVVLVFGLISCSDNTEADDSASETKQTAAGEDVSLSSEYSFEYVTFFRPYKNTLSGSLGEPRVFKIFSADFFDRLLIPGMQGFDDNAKNEYFKKSVLELTEKYDEEFFKENAVLYFEIPRLVNKNCRITISRLSYKDNKIEFAYERAILSEEEINGPAQIGFILEVPKSLLNENTEIIHLEPGHPLA